MTSTVLTPEQFQALETTSSTQAVKWFTGWIMCMGLDGFRAVCKLKGIVGNFEGQLYCQMASVRTDDPGAATAIANTTFTGAESKFDVSSFGSTTGPVFFIRFGVGYKVTGGGSFARADVSLQLCYPTCGPMVGVTTQQMQNSVGSGGKTIYPITDFFPAYGAAVVKMAIVITGIDGATFNAALVYQTADTSKQATNAWVVANVWNAGPTTSWNSATESCTAECVPQASITAMWMRLGLQVWSGSAGTLTQASVSTRAAVRR